VPGKESRHGSLGGTSLGTATVFCGACTARSLSPLTIKAFHSLRAFGRHLPPPIQTLPGHRWSRNGWFTHVSNCLAPMRLTPNPDGA
jgi:hypothetical protein